MTVHTQWKPTADEHVSSAPLNWDDLRLVLTIARCGSLNAAAVQLEVNVSTASRRLNHIEGALGILCFVRRPSGIEPTTAGQLVIDHAAEIEKQTVNLKRAAAIAQASRSATVTITAPDSLGSALVIPVIAELLIEKRDTPVNLITDNRTLDLHRGEADLALRLRRPENGGLRIRKIADMGYGLFASSRYLEKAGLPQSLSDLNGHAKIGVRTAYPNHPPAEWWDRQCRSGRVTLRTDRTQDRLTAANADLGITILPVVIGRGTELKQVLAAEKVPGLEVFLLADPGALRVREVRDLAERLARHAKRKAAALGDA